MSQTHFGDPCIHCGIPHDDVPAGACRGAPSKAIILEYCVARQAWQNPGTGCETVLCYMSTGDVRQESWHPSYHFAYSERFKNAKTLAPHEFYRKHSVQP